PDFIFVLDLRGMIQQVNPTVLQRSGYREAELLNHAFADFLTPTEHQGPQAFIDLFETEMGRQEVQWMMPEGQVHSMDCSWRVIRYGEVDPYVLVLQRDISDRKLLETRLRSSEQQMRAIFEAMNDVILMCHVQEGEITDIEIAPTDPSIYEGIENNCIGQTVQHLWHGGENGWGTQVRQALATGQAVEFEYCLAVDNHEHWFTASVSPMSEQAVLWVARDISERKQFENALQRSEARYREIYNNTPVMLHSIDAQGNLISVSNYWLEKLGYQRHEVLGRKSTEFLTPASQQQARDLYLPQFRQQGFVQNATYQFVTQTGAVMDVLLSAIAERGPRGQIERSLAVIIDVTGLKQVEQQLHKANAELIRSNRELEQFAYVASHDLKEPLRMVTSFTELLAQTYTGQLDAKADQMIAFAVDGATRMQQLIDDLLTYSRVGTQRNTLVSLDCGVVLEAAKANLQMAIAESQAVIDQGPLPTLVTDCLQLQQLWQNLLGNAIKYRRDCPPEIEIGAEEQAHQWQFFVRDNGIGMEPVHAERIFMIFQRLHTKQEYPGTGIGLAICSKIVEQLGGEIWVESELGKGSTFYFTLPK
ncbi:MAG: PAS domain S-box protein, partial [Cyanobacteria bacterium P01_A01_bin.17]